MRATLTIISLFLLLMSCEEKAIKTSGSIKKIQLAKEWRIMRSADIIATDKEISNSGYNDNSWISTSVPTTVMNALVKNGTIKRPFFSDNMAKVDSNLFNSSWYFRKVFTLSSQESSQVANLSFEGINYSAKILLNGTDISEKEPIIGAYNTYSLNVTGALREGENVLLVEVTAPQPGDFTVGFVDWAPTPPDKNMGIWRPVTLELSGAVTSSDIFVKTNVDTETLKSADLTIETTVTNFSEEDVSGILKGQIGEIQFEKAYQLKRGEKSLISVSAKEIDELHIDNPKLWWPIGYGDPNMYQLVLTNEINGVASDVDTIDFGIREVSDFFNENGHRGYKVNGEIIQIKGAGWVDNLFLADSTFSNKTQVDYVKEMNMNTIRFEGYWGNSQEIYDLCDKEGLLAMVGWSCQWEWKAYLLKDFPEEEELGGIVEKDEMELVNGYFEDMVKWLRNHPSIFVYTAGSDFIPRAELEKMYLKTLKDFDPTRPYLGAAKSWNSTVSGPTGVKMEGPYDWVPPVYWYSDTARGGAFGFNTETGPGPQPPVYDNLVKMMTKEDAWPLSSSMWNYHSGRHEFGTMKRYLKGFDARYGEAKDAEDFCYRAQLASYEAIRPMFESFSANKPNATGVIQWMLNSAWPETFWQQYDYYLTPTGAFYGTKKGAKPLNLVYNYGDQSVYLVNDSHKSYSNVSFEFKQLSSGSFVIANTNYRIDEVVPFSSVKLTNVDLTHPSFVRLKLLTNENEILVQNDYWLDPKQDVMDPDYNNSSWIYTPTVELTNYQWLNTLPLATVKLEQISNEEIRLTNTSDKVAFGIQLKAYDTKDRFVTALTFSDNYFMLFPGETKLVKANSRRYKGAISYTMKSINVK